MHLWHRNKNEINENESINSWLQGLGEEIEKI